VNTLTDTERQAIQRHVAIIEKYEADVEREHERLRNRHDFHPPFPPFESFEERRELQRRGQLVEAGLVKFRTAHPVKLTPWDTPAKIASDIDIEFNVLRHLKIQILNYDKEPEKLREAYNKARARILAFIELAPSVRSEFRESLDPQAGLDSIIAWCAHVMRPHQADRGRGADPEKATHSTDFTFVNWFGTQYTFALGVQSSAVSVLWGEWAKSGLGLHQDTIRNAIDAERDSFRMDTAFRNNAAFDTMIQRCGDGKYKLAPPSARPPVATGNRKKSATSAPESRRKRV
jgi:hypothetical protein